MNLHKSTEPDTEFSGLDWLLSIGMALTWGSSFLLIKIAIRDFDSSVIPLGRTAFGAAALLLIPSARKRICQRTLASTTRPRIRLDGVAVLVVSTCRGIGL